MPFLRFSAEDHEWGFRVPDGFIPAVGDKVELWYALPDEESNDLVTGTVIQRLWPLASADIADRVWEIELEVELESPIPDGCIADSTAWPSETHTERQEEMEATVRQVYINLRRKSDDGKSTH